MITIYKMTNRLNGKLYVGQTNQPLEKRLYQHSKAKTPLGDAMRTCGLSNFTIETIETCETRGQANDREQFWVKELKSKAPDGYNQTDGGAGVIGCTTQRRPPTKRSFTILRHLQLPKPPAPKPPPAIESWGEIEQIKQLAAHRGYTLNDLFEEFNRRFGTKYQRHMFFKRILSGAARYDRLKQCGEILGFKIKLVDLEDAL